jgi:prepilin-type N-terminal cleavage/methylation domain-containing protein/prepilin-type processing-associated H-X9-DG protein
MVATQRPDGRIRRGFTLIELLVVIGIIALLAAILVPVFTRARAKSWQANCLSNQKQIVTGMLMLLQETKGEFPAAETVWDELGLTGKVLHCPASSSKDWANAYAFNENLCHTKLAMYPSPEHVVVVADGATRTNLARHDTDLAYRHNGAVMVGCADGHVELTKPQACIELYPLGSVVSNEEEAEQKFGFTIRPAKVGETFPEGISGHDPTPEEYQQFFTLNLPYFSLWPDTGVNLHGHSNPAIKEIVIVADRTIASGKGCTVDGVWYLSAGTCMDVSCYIIAFDTVDRIIDDKEWIALNNPPTTPYGDTSMDSADIKETLPNFLSASMRISPSAERWDFWHALIAQNAWVRYRADHDAAIKAKMTMLQTRTGAALQVPWPYFDAAFWNYMSKPQHSHSEGIGGNDKHYERLDQ